VLAHRRGTSRRPGASRPNRRLATNKAHDGARLAKPAKKATTGRPGTNAAARRGTSRKNGPEGRSRGKVRPEALSRPKVGPVSAHRAVGAGSPGASVRPQVVGHVPLSAQVGHVTLLSESARKRENAWKIAPCFPMKKTVFDHLLRGLFWVSIFMRKWRDQSLKLCPAGNTSTAPS